VRRLVELTEGCYSGGDSEGVRVYKVTPVSLRYPLSVLNKNFTLKSEVILSRVFPNESTVEPNDRSQSLCCVLPITWCAFGAPQTLALPSDQPRADALELSRFLPSFLGKMAVFDKTEPPFFIDN